MPVNSQNSRSARDTSDSDRPASLFDRLIWICPPVGLVGIATLAWLFGLTPWTAIAVAFLVTCPLLIAWLLLGHRFK